MKFHFEGISSYRTSHLLGNKGVDVFSNKNPRLKAQASMYASFYYSESMIGTTAMWFAPGDDRNFIAFTPVSYKM